MYELVKKSNQPYWSKETSQYVLDEICRKNNISIDFVDKEGASSSIGNKIKYLFVKVKQMFKRGGRQGLELLKNTKCTLKLGGVKRKMQHQLESEKKRRKLAEAQIKQACNENRKLKKEVKTTKILVNRILKRRLSQTNKQKGKQNYTRQWKSRQQKRLNSETKILWDFISKEGLTPKSLCISDHYGNTSSLDENLGHDKCATIPVDTMLFVKDKCGIPNKSYQ